MRTHQLKILPDYFKAVYERRKNFEIRNNDRHFAVGDTVCLLEWTGDDYTGRAAFREITYITDFKQEPGYVAFGMK